MIVSLEPRGSPFWIGHKPDLRVRDTGSAWIGHTDGDGRCRLLGVEREGGENHNAEHADNRN